MEAAHGSLVRGALTAKPTAKTSAAPAPIFTTFKLGMQQLIDAIMNRLEPANIRLGCEVRNLGKANNQWRVEAANQQAMTFDRVILALPAYAEAKLLRHADAQLAATLDQIPYSSSVTVAVAFEEKQLPGVRLPQGFGFLVPRSEKIPISACTFVHNKFRHRAPASCLLLRFFMPEAIDWSGERIHAVVAQEMKNIFGITAAPRELSIFRWPRSMAQYEVGHLDRISSIEKAVARHNGLELIGNAYRGIGVPDCIREGKDAAGRVMRSIFAQ
jgi:oxygen-dependent protoporphyrinogen oxidase